MCYAAAMTSARLGLPILLAALAACAETPGSPPAAIALPPGVQAVSLPGPPGVTLRAALALPEGAATAPVVLALHGCGGIGTAGQPLALPAREREWARRLTAAGHPVLFPDSFGSRGLGQACGMRNFPADAEATRAEDAQAAARWALAQPWAPAGGVLLLGWSHGGSTALGAVRAPVPQGLIRAAVAFYPGCLATERRGDWRPGVPLLMLLGEADNWTPSRYCQRLAGEMPGVSMRAYPGAHHGFDAPNAPTRNRTLADGRIVTTGTDPAARTAALAAVTEFFAAHGGPAR
jgi:dienelactone hydrolase